MQKENEKGILAYAGCLLFRCRSFVYVNEAL